MSRKKKRKQRRGNIEAKSYYDPFPKSGLVRQYERFIRKHVSEFCERYGRLKYDDALCWAVEIALKAEKAFNPELGFDFSTPLRHHLKGLHRLAEREIISTPVLGAQRRKQEEAKAAKLPGGRFFPGANGTRVTVDYNKRRRSVARVQLASAASDRVQPIWSRAAPDVEFLLDRDLDLSIGRAYIRAVLDHHERRQDENESGVIHSEVRARTGGVDIAHSKRRQPPRFEPDRVPTASLDDAYRHDDEWVGKLSDTIVAGATPQTPDDLVLYAIRAERPFMGGLEAAVADWMVGIHTETDARSLVQFADDQGISKGWASKLRDRVIDRVRRRLKNKSS